MMAWVCFQCPAHSRRAAELAAHKRSHPGHIAEWIDTLHSHRWTTIHGQHPRISGHCMSAKHKEVNQ